MFSKFSPSRALGLLATALTVTAAACGGSNPNPLAPATAVVAAPAQQAVSYSAGLRTVAQTAGIAPAYLPGGNGTNYTCTALASMRGEEWLGDTAKLDNAPTAGSYTVTDGVISVSITNGTATTFDWTSSMPVDAVFVKSGQNGHNLYVYPGESTRGTGLSRS